MPIQTQQQKIRAIKSMKQDLCLIKCITQHQIEIDRNHFPKKIKTTTELSNVLFMKNKQLFFLERRHSFQKQQGTFTNKNLTKMSDFDFHSIKVCEEKEKIIEEILKKSKDSTMENEISQISMSLIEKFNSTKPEENMNGAPIRQYFQLLGLAQVADTFNISSDNNTENIEDLISCLRIINNEDEQRLLIRKKPQKREKIQDIQDYKQIFRVILNTRAQKPQLPLLSLMEHQKIKEKYNFTENFLFLFNQIKKFMKNSTYNEKKCLNEQQSFFQNVSLFDENIIHQSDRYSQALFWQKLCNLFLSGPAQYYHIEYLLNYKKEFEILKHFKCLLEKQPSTFQQSQQLMAANNHYRQFVFMLKGEYLQQLLQNSNQDEERLLLIAIRQAIFLREKLVPRDFHLQFLKKEGEKKVQSLKTSLLNNQSETSIRKEVSKLFILGQYWRVISIYFHFGKITYLQALWLWGLIAEIDYRHSTILMYDHNKTLSLFESKLLKIIQSIKSNYEIQSYYLLIKIFKPCWLHGSLNKDYTINLITSNQLLLEYLMETIGCSSFLKSFQLDFSDITEIINKSVENYQDYAYCYQLTLSSVLDLKELPNIVANKREQKQEQKVSSIRQLRTSHHIYNVGRKYNKFEKLYLNIFTPTSQHFLQQNRDNRFSIFRNGFINLIKTNLFLLESNKTCEKKYQQISYINKIYKSFNSTLAKKKIMQCLNNQDPRQIQNREKQIDNLVNILVLCSNMLKIRNSIRNRQFQYIVQSYNVILQDISDNFPQTLTNLQNLLDNPSDSINIIYTFICDIIQSLLYLRQSKPKVITSNSRNIRRFCKEIYSFTKYIKFRKEQGDLLSQQLQKFIRDIDS